MSESFKSFEVADHLKSEAAIDAYLAACAETGDPALMAAAFGDVARARSMAAVAKKVGMSRAGLYKALSRTGKPSFETVSKVAAVLGYRLQPVKIAIKPKRSRRRAA